MYPFLTSQINDEHRRDLLREASAEQLADDLRQVRIAARLAQQARPHTPLISIDAAIYQASIALTE